MGENFARVETKYLLSLTQAAQIEMGLRQQGFVKMVFGSPKVQSLYYDTEDHALIRASLERPIYKEKLRLRAYGEPGALTGSFLEIKKKYRGVVYKRRVAMPLQEAADGLLRGKLPEASGQVGREAAWMARRYGLMPAAVIAYDRDAWFCEDEPGVRVTLDRNLIFRDQTLDLDASAPGLSLLPGGQRLMEIKTGGAYPLWLSRLLAETKAKRVHFSKYGLAYQQYIQPGKEGNERSGANCSTVSLPKGA
ncbi:MAG: polyphosphate polymerase domain-containing protein [Clostridia bacterium]|nr:polyphosphate polymerase domain-containing protein [Clostridia bacterium]